MSPEGAQPASKRFQASRLSEIFGADRRSLALFRMLIGADFVYEWINRATSLTEHYTDAGVLPRALMPAVARRLALPLFRLSGGATFQATLLIVACLFAAMLMVGYRTRLATIATWILHLAVIERLPAITGGGDNLMRYCCSGRYSCRWEHAGQSTIGCRVVAAVPRQQQTALAPPSSRWASQRSSFNLLPSISARESTSWNAQPGAGRRGLSGAAGLHAHHAARCLDAQLPPVLSLTSRVLPVLQIRGPSSCSFLFGWVPCGP